MACRPQNYTLGTVDTGKITEGKSLRIFSLTCAVVQSDSIMAMRNRTDSENFGVTIEAFRFVLLRCYKRYIDATRVGPNRGYL